MKVTRMFIPPNGYAGQAQQTQANQLIGVRGTRTTTRRRRKKATRTTVKRRTKRRAGKPARLVKGSRAAKAYMAKIRRKRKK